MFVSRNSDFHEHFNGFFSVTTVHGCQYLVDPRLSWIGRIFWAFIIVLAFVLGGSFICVSNAITDIDIHCPLTMSLLSGCL